MTAQTIDVLIPVYNGAATVRDAVGSIQRQTVQDIHIVVVDDGSTDATPAILAEIARDDPRVQVVTQANGGIVDALNAGLRECSQEFVARHDADDLADPDRFARQAAFLRANPDVVAVASLARHMDEHGNRPGTVTDIPEPDKASATWAPSREPYLLHPFLMARTAAVRAVGGYRYVFHSEDTDLYWRLREQGRLHGMPEVMGDYRIHPNSVSSRSVRNGRISAVNSQLAAISARRRQAGQPDIDFPKAKIARYEHADSLREIVALGAEELTAEETAYLELAVSAKIVELAYYRPYELDAADCRFIRDSLARHGHLMTDDNRAELDKVLSGTAARLLGKGLVRSGLDVARPRHYPMVAAKLAFHKLAPASVRRRRR